MNPNGNRAKAPSGREVVITGVGLISPLGNAAPALWASLRAGRSGIGAVPHLALDAYRTRVGGAVRDFQPRQYIADPKSLKLMTRPVRLGVAAMELAVRDAGLADAAALTAMDPARIGCFVGSPGHAGDRDELLPALDLAYQDHGLDLRVFGADGIATINPLWLLKSLANLVLYFVSLRLGAQGPNANICMSGAGGAIAIGEAMHAIRHGRADIAVAGGYESLLDEERLESFEPSGLLYLGEGAPESASRPFDRDRAGFVAAEGGAFVVLEEAESARRRGARLYATLRGYGSASSGSPGRPNDSVEAFHGAMEAALADARLDAWELKAVFAQGLATAESDHAEAQALKQLLTARAAYTPIAAVKSMTGNLLAGSGPLELIAALGALDGPEAAMPPILNCEHPDPDLGLDYVRGAARPGQFGRILVNAGGLGGTVASLVVERRAD
jgi:3-oxoacyl-[acyl-carrier-protein] synthase II